MTTPNKWYLGDGVYVDIDSERGAVKLTTEDGIRETNTIFLEPQVLAQFQVWLERMRERFPRL